VIVLENVIKKSITRQKKYHKTITKNEKNWLKIVEKRPKNGQKWSIFLKNWVFVIVVIVFFLSFA